MSHQLPVDGEVAAVCRTAGSTVYHHPDCNVLASKTRDPQTLARTAADRIGLSPGECCREQWARDGGGADE